MKEIKITWSSCYDRLITVSEYTKFDSKVLVQKFSENYIENLLPEFVKFSFLV